MNNAECMYTNHLSSQTLIIARLCGKLERLQERALSTLFLEKSPSYKELLKKNGQLSVKMNIMRFLII